MTISQVLVQVKQVTSHKGNF